MHTKIHGRHVEITQALSDYVNEKLKKIERHSDVQSVEVILSVDNLSHQAEATLRLKGPEIFAKSHHDDMYAAIDALCDKLSRQLIDRKEKLIGRKHQNR